MSIIASCGHKLTNEDGPDGLGFDISVRETSADNRPAVAYRSVCKNCLERYQASGLLLNSYEEEIAYLRKK
jgi:hypothetical protein